MNHRERFTAAMHYEPRDRAPLYDFNFWDETIPEWKTQGLPDWVTRGNARGFFGLDWSVGGDELVWDTGCQCGLYPWFEAKVLEDRGDHELAQQGDGVRVLRKKHLGSIPHPERHLLEDRESWEEHYKWRLDPSNPGRYPAKCAEGGAKMTWEDRVTHWCDPLRDHPIVLPGGSLYGDFRNYMGVENLSLLVYDDPELFEEMVSTKTDCIVGVLERILATGAKFEACAMWGDMCYNSGPLLNPEHFKEFLVPQYKRITSLLKRHGVGVVWVDCDGLIDHLAPLWLEAGVNCMFPIEVGTWQADPVKLREQYGRDMLLMGGFDKRILANSKDEITREIERLAPLVEEGGFIPMPDHRVPPNVPLENYVHYCDTARVIWGKNTDLNVKATGPAPKG